MEKYYKILGIDKDADQKEIKKAYYTLVKQFHPDMHVNSPDVKKLEEEFIKINEAYCYLTNVKAKQRFCVVHSDKEALASCVFCNSPLCEECCSETGIISCPDCYEEFKKGQIELLKRPLIDTIVGVIIGILIGNIIAYIIPFEDNFILSLVFSVYFVGVLWYFGENKTKRTNSAVGLAFDLVFGLIIGWFIGFIKALIGFVPSLIKYLIKILDKNNRAKY